MTKRAAIYVRQSQTHDDTISPALQEAHCKEVCEREGFEVIDIYRDIDISGRSTTNRPALLKLVADHKAGKFDVAIADDYSRFARNMADGASIIGTIPVGTYAEGIPEDDSDDFAPLLYLLLAHKFSTDMSKRWKSTHSHRLARGLSANGSVPWGYQSVDGKAVVDPDKAPVIRKMFRDYTSGIGAKTISNGLYEDGHAESKVWSTTAVYRILDNPFYAGKIRWAEEEFPGKQETIISEDEWAAYLRERGKRKVKGKRNVRSTRWLYSGLVVCGECGSVMVYTAINDSLACSSNVNKGKAVCSGVWRKASRTMLGIHMWIQKHNAEISELVPSTDEARQQAQQTVETAQQSADRVDEDITALLLMAVRQRWDDKRISGAMAALEQEKAEAATALFEARANLGSIPEPDSDVWMKFNALGNSTDEDGSPTFTPEATEQIRAYLSRHLKEVRILPLPRAHKHAHLWEGLEFVKVSDS